MESFTYLRAANPADALGAMAANSKYLAGGTTLVDLMKLHVETPAKLIDINPLPLAKIEPLPGGGLRIGAMVRNSDLAWDETVRKNYPVLSHAILSGASAQLRNMATTGGNLLQRTRCSYFRDSASACNKRQPGSGCAAIDGVNRVHAVLGTSDKCIATYPGDMAVAMTALDAIIRVQGPDGDRQIPIKDFFVSYGDDPAKETTLRPGELITAVDLPAIPYATRSHYLKVRDRASYEFALASAAVLLDIDAGTIRKAHIALGGIATMPWRADDAEKALAGQKAGDDAYHAAAEAALQGAHPQKHNAFKIDLAKRTLVRALQTAAAIA